MKILRQNDLYQITVTLDELTILKGCINEALELAPSEFQTRVGIDQKEAEILITTIIRAMQNC